MEGFSMEPIFQVKSGEGLLLSVYDDFIIIEPIGFLGFTRHGVSGKLTIPYKNITSIQFQPNTFLHEGFIEFYCLGHNTLNQGGDVNDGAYNDTRFYFQKKELNTMLKVNEFIQDKINNKPAVKKESNGGNIQQLRELKALLDDGIITQEEFNKKKKQILGL